MSCLGVRQGNQRESDEKHPPAKTFNFQPGIRGAASPASYWLNFGVRELSHSLVASGTDESYHHLTSPHSLTTQASLINMARVYRTCANQ